MLQTVDDLEALRYCDTLTGTVVLSVNDPMADYSVFYDNEVIEGGCDHSYWDFII